MRERAMTDARTLRALAVCRLRLSALPARHVLVALAFLGYVIAYTDRVNISVAAVVMKEHFGWTQTEKGLVLSSFFIGYMLCMFIAGVIATRFGGKRVSGGAVLIWSLFTLLTPLAAVISLPVLFAARIGMGMGEAGLFPATFELFGRRIPATERARATSRFCCGMPVGTVIGLLVSGWLVGRYGWPMPFYAFGLAGLLWTIFWFSQVPSSPPYDLRVDAKVTKKARTVGAAVVEPVRSGDRRRAARWSVDVLCAVAVVAELFSRRPARKYYERGLLLRRSVARNGTDDEHRRVGVRPHDTQRCEHHERPQDHAVWWPRPFRIVPAGYTRRAHALARTDTNDWRGRRPRVHMVRVRGRNSGRRAAPRRFIGGIHQHDRTSSRIRGRGCHGLARGSHRNLHIGICSGGGNWPCGCDRVRTLLQRTSSYRLIQWHGSPRKE